MTEIKLDSDAVQNIVAKALLEELSEEARNSLIQQAITYLIAAPKNTNHYSNRPEKSPLQVAFEKAAVEVADGYVRELFKKDEFKSQVDRAVLKFVNEKFKESGWLYDSIGVAVGNRVGELLRDRARDDD